MGLGQTQQRDRARNLRREATAAEQRLWTALRDRQFEGLKFVRQQPIGPYIADFVCRQLRLIIEVDGPTHESAEAQQHDRERTRFLAADGYRVVRISNEAVMGEMDAVLDWLRAAVRR